MDRLRQIEVFLAVAQSRSFTAAASRLGMSRANVTKQISGLERELGAQLLNRNTQHVAPTEAGLLLMSKGAHLLGDFHTLASELQDKVTEPAGVIRVGVPPSFGAAHLVPAVAAFLRLYPGTEVALCLDRGDAELVRDGLDLSLRIATVLKDASYIARLLVRVPQRLVAAQAYLDRAGMPLTLSDLAGHDCLVHRLKSPNDEWHFQEGGQTIALPVHGTITSDFGEALRSAALIGQGISMHPTYMVADDIAAGRLVHVLPHVEPAGLAITAIYPQRNVPVRVRMLIDFLMTWLRGESSWLPPSERRAPASARRARVSL
jgi:DNA-binding transcriptional LysR family regulator